MSADTRLLSTRPTGSWESSGSFFSRLSPLTLESNHFKIIQTPHSLRGTFYPDNKSIRWFEQQPADAHYLTLFVISLDLSRSKTHSSQFGDTINEPSHPSPTPTSSPSTDQTITSSPVTFTCSPGGPSWPFTPFSPCVPFGPRSPWMIKEKW